MANKLKIKVPTLTLIFLYDTSAPVVQSNYLNLDKAPSLSNEKNNKIKMNKMQFNSAGHLTHLMCLDVSSCMIHF